MNFRNPKPFKDGDLIFNQFRPKDLIILGLSGVISVGLVLLVVNTLPAGTMMLIGVIVSIIPGGLGFLLTGKRHGFHNFYEFWKVAFYYNNKYQRNYMWEGVILDDSETEEI